eukprot:evm.model.scf_4676.1 EVM.evm.TU.scf_4676.1   scf_4676:104-2674(-)
MFLRSVLRLASVDALSQWPCARWVSTSASPGLIGIAGLHAPQDFEKLARDAIKRCGALAREAGAGPAGPATVGLVDEISDGLCRVADAAEFVASAHRDADWRATAGRAALMMGDCIRELNADEGLNSALSAVVDKLEDRACAADQRGRDLGDLGEFSDEAILVARRMLWDFNRAGAHLGPGARKRIERLRGLEQEACMEFSQAVRGPGGSRSVGLGPREVMGLAPAWRQRARSVGGAWELKVDFWNMPGLLAGVGAEALRRRIYMACMTALPGNLHILDNLVQVRREIAETLGEESYARVALRNTLAESPNAVIEFLTQTSVTAKQMADEELKGLKRIKGGDIFAWDVWHYMQKAEVAILPGPDPPVFHLKGIIRGLKSILKEVFGVVLSKEPLADGEAWDGGLMKLVAREESGEEIGCLYLDLFDRPYKYAGAAHFTVRCGRRLADGSYQTPVVVLVSRFPRNKKRLRYWELKTLLHEFGHALNSLLCRTEYQHLFGTRAPMDMVEIQSQFMEHFISVPEILEMLGAEDCQGNPPTREALRHVIAVERLWRGFRIQEQVLQALVDQALFGPTPPARGKTSQVMEELTMQHGSLPFVTGTHQQVWCTHLTTYGASMYSYLYAANLAAQIWQRHFASDPFCAQAGRHIRTALMEPGGAKEPYDLVVGVLDSSALESVHEGWMPNPDFNWCENALI